MNELLNEVWTMLIVVKSMVGEEYFALGWGRTGCLHPIPPLL